MKRLTDIENCYGREDIFKALREHSAEFDFEKFYTDNIGNDYVLHTGFRLISTNQVVECFCASNGGMHENIIENVLYAMFDDFNDVYKKNVYDWRGTCADLGVIACQLISNHYTLIWIPQRINRFQYNVLMDLYKEICDLKSKYPIKVHFNFNFLNGKKEYDIISLEAMPNYIKKIVSEDDFCFDEYIVNSGRKGVKK